MIQPSELTDRAVRSSAAALVLTDRQAAILAVVDRYFEATGEPCPGNYLARRLRLHHSTIAEHLQRLHRKGWLRAPNAPAVPSRPPG